MQRFLRYMTAPLRFRTSKGFGVHSPFAFSFITDVMTQNYQYYSYVEQERRNRQNRDSRPARYQHLIFRIFNYFEPANFVVLGHPDMLDVEAALDYSSSAVAYSLFTDVCGPRVRPVESIGEAQRLLESEAVPMALVGGALHDDSRVRFILSLLRSGGVAVFTDLVADRWLWDAVNSSLKLHGMTFSNDRVGVIVGLQHLPRQTYMLWL